MIGEQPLQLPARYRVLAERALRGKNLTFRDISLRDFDREVELCWEIYNAAWEKNWGFVPMSKESFLHEAQVLRYILNPNFAFIAEVNGEPAGFMIVVPDYHHAFKAIGTGRLLPTGLFKLLAAKRSLRVGRVMILGVKAGYRRRGIFALLADEAYRRGKKFDWIGGEASWVLEDNDALNRPMAGMGAKEYRRWRIYDKALA
jgi:GNAT superfamily N-acetyltransferase